MLRLKNIKKDYVMSSATVNALKGINISFRRSEFVSILGPSGCGKTTLLNIIGGLDQYTSGDLIINGISTKEFKDRDWDVYRNHRVGFIFQSYNLIPHQSVLGNVELSLTIAGYTKKERQALAKKTLDRVGLCGEYYKKPNQLSGGQCQRVAIARSLINNPDILLADEPTGALDTVTSLQIMDLIKEIATERLVIMVTHNPELAQTYSTRIIKLLDGEVTDDTNPENEDEEIKEVERVNQLAKEQETRFVDEQIVTNIEELENLRPIYVKKYGVAGAARKIRKKREGNRNKVLQQMENNKKEKAKMSFFTAFKLSLQNLITKKARTILTAIAGSIGIIGVSLVLAISYGVRSYITNMQDDMLSGNPIEISESGYDLSALMGGASFGQKVEIATQAGTVPIEQVLASIAKNVELTDSFLVNNQFTQSYFDYIQAMPSEYLAAVYYNYGLEMRNNIYTDFYFNPQSNPQKPSLSVIKNTYSSILLSSPYGSYASYIDSFGRIFMEAPDSEDYILSQYEMLYGQVAKEKNEVMIVLNDNKMLTDILLAQLGYYTQEEFLNSVYEITPNSDGTPNPNFNPALKRERYTYEELIGKTFYWYDNDQIFNVGTNPYSPFTYNPYANNFTNGLELKVVGILEAKPNIMFGCLQSGFYYTAALTQHALNLNYNSQIANYLRNQNEEKGSDYILSGEFNTGSDTSSSIGITYNFSFVDFEGIAHNNVVGYVGNTSQMQMFMSLISNIMGGGSSSKQYTLSLREVGGNRIVNEVFIYPVNFELKDGVTDYLDRWNSDEILIYENLNGETIVLFPDERQTIKYSDNIAVIITMINTMIDIVTYALIGFTALALLVSCVMIGIITYVSVVERTKEIGVLRSLGGRKVDISNLFNSETFIIGFVSGMLGIITTWLLSFVLNTILAHYTPVKQLAIFPVDYALYMLLLSILLSIISGLVPATRAAKKDPVNALRTE
ncbi:MAG: ABC transporter ATP-binding protein/permease [Acholeplasmatales bacterium]|jgi:putative ABC transport system permease protein|nr:ABC transporter ATP-binding protein/permease [Acholeplasmatales bacterium]